MKISRITLASHRDQLLPLLQRHWDEIRLAGAPDIDFKIDEQLYDFVDKSKCSVILVLKTDEGEVAGYLSVFIYPHPHHLGHRFAVTDCFFVDKKYRSVKSYRAVKEMFAIAETIAKLEYGVSYMQFTFGANNDLSRLGHSLGYADSNISMIKRLI